MDIILSIKPKHAEKIINGTKTVDFRKQVPNRPTHESTIYIYITAPVRKIAGFFKTKCITWTTKNDLWDLFSEKGGIPKAEFDTYFKNNKWGYAIEINNLYIYDKFFDPNDLFEKFRPPQNFCYVKREKAQTCII